MTRPMHEFSPQHPPAAAAPPIDLMQTGSSAVRASQTSASGYAPQSAQWSVMPVAVFK
jgi:hypothetical protein